MALTSLKHVAESSGFSIATVSEVLNGGGKKSNIRVSEATREKVMAVARRMNYRPNILARGLKGGKTKTVAILFSLRGPHNPGQLVQMIAGKIHERQYVTQIADTFCNMEIVRNHLRDYIRRGVDAVVIQIIPGMRVEGFDSLFQSFQAVVLIPSLPLETSADQVILCRQQAVREAVDHLVDTGRRRPMILIPSTLREEKTDSILKRFRERGLTFEKEPTIFHEENFTATTEVAFRALETQYPDSVPFDALLCGTDEAAVAAYSWLHQRGKKIPDDAAVVGFNDSMYANFMIPPLASVNRQDDQMAGLVEKTLFDRLENPDLPPQRANLRMKFVLRASAG
ncbi:MAG: LacI family DNA-binding transcriptional regulator [Phycisphaerae bacterium]|nr:LacI family DNA-binding transcriptional regulator [Phycisphaerae bacterium]